MQKSDLHHIDDLFKNHFESFEVPVANREKLWRKIAGKDNSRRMLLWLFCGIGVASLAWVVSAEVDFNKKGEKASNELSNLESLEVHKSNDARVKTLVSIIKASEEDHEKEDDAKELNAKGEAAVQLVNQKGKNVLEKIKSVPTTISDRSKRTVKKRAGKYIEEEAIDEKAKHEKAKDDKAIDEGTLPEVGKGQDGIQSSQARTNAVDFQSKLELESFTAVARIQEKEVVEGMKGENEIKEAVSALLDEVREVSQRKTSRDIATLEKRINTLTTSRPVLNDKYKSKLVCATNGSDGLAGHFFVDLYSGVSFSMDQVSLNPGFIDELVYRDTWEERYTTLPSLSAGLAVGYETDKGMSLSGGVEYQRLESQYRTTQTVTEIIMVYDPMAYFYYDANNEIVWVADSVTAISQYDRTVSLGSKTHLISIPLQLAIPIVSKSGWHIKALVGGAFNFSMTHRGHHLRDDLIVDPVTSSNERTYMNEAVGISIDGGIHIGRYLSEKLELYVSPRYRYNRTSYLNSAEHLSVSRDFLGLRMGARYHLD